MRVVQTHKTTVTNKDPPISPKLLFVRSAVDAAWKRKAKWIVQFARKHV